MTTNADFENILNLMKLANDPEKTAARITQMRDAQAAVDRQRAGLAAEHSRIEGEWEALRKAKKAVEAEREAVEAERKRCEGQAERNAEAQRELSRLSADLSESRSQHGAAISKAKEDLARAARETKAAVDIRAEYEGKLRRLEAAVA